MRSPMPMRARATQSRAPPFLSLSNPPPPSAPHLKRARGMAPTANQESACSDDVAVREETTFLFGGVDKSMLHRAVRESKAIVARILDKIYPGWQWCSTRRYYSFVDGATRVPHPEDVTISEILHIFSDLIRLPLPLPYGR
jgi:hypothetical protein